MKRVARVWPIWPQSASLSQDELPCLALAGGLAWLEVVLTAVLSYAGFTKLSFQASQTCRPEAMAHVASGRHMLLANWPEEAYKSTLG